MCIMSSRPSDEMNCRMEDMRLEGGSGGFCWNSLASCARAGAVMLLAIWD